MFSKDNLHLDINITCIEPNPNLFQSTNFLNLDFQTTYLTCNVCFYITNLINHCDTSHIEFLNVTQDFLYIQKYVYSKQKS